MAIDKATPAAATDDTRQKSSESYLIFRAGSHDFALPTRFVRHLVPSLDLFTVTDGPRWFAGLLRLPDLTALAIDLRVYFELPHSSPPSAAIAVDLLHPDLPPVALLADRLSTTELFRKCDLRPLRKPSQIGFQQFVSSAWRGRSRPSYILDLERLLSTQDADQLRLWLQLHL